TRTPTTTTYNPRPVLSRPIRTPTTPTTPYPTLFPSAQAESARNRRHRHQPSAHCGVDRTAISGSQLYTARRDRSAVNSAMCGRRSEEHTSELQSRSDIVCRLLLEKKKVYVRMFLSFC